MRIIDAEWIHQRVTAELHGLCGGGGCMGKSKGWKRERCEDKMMFDLASDGRGRDRVHLGSSGPALVRAPAVEGGARGHSVASRVVCGGGNHCQVANYFPIGTKRRDCWARHPDGARKSGLLPGEEAGRCGGVGPTWLPCISGSGWWWRCRAPSSIRPCFRFRR